MKVCENMQILYENISLKPSFCSFRLPYLCSSICSIDHPTTAHSALSATFWVFYNFSQVCGAAEICCSALLPNSGKLQVAFSFLSFVRSFRRECLSLLKNLVAKKVFLLSHFSP